MTAKEVKKWHGKACVVTLKQGSVLVCSGLRYVDRNRFGKVDIALSGNNVLSLMSMTSPYEEVYTGIRISWIRPAAIKSIKARKP